MLCVVGVTYVYSLLLHLTFNLIVDDIEVWLIIKSDALSN